MVGPGVVPDYCNFNNLDCQTVLTAIMGTKGYFLRCKTRVVTVAKPHPQGLRPPKQL